MSYFVYLVLLTHLHRELLIFLLQYSAAFQYWNGCAVGPARRVARILQRTSRAYERAADRGHSACLHGILQHVCGRQVFQETHERILTISARAS